MTFNNFGQIGAAVVGDGNMLVGQQANRAEVSAADALAAIEALMSALSASDRVPSSQRKESAEVFEHLKTEAAKERPNKTLVGGLVASVRDVAELLQAAPGAWGTLKGWAGSLF